MPEHALHDFYSRNDDELSHDAEWPSAHSALLEALERGELRAAECVDGEWRANEWVKRAILVGFRRSEVVAMPAAHAAAFFDKADYPARTFALEDRVRLVPGGTAVRRGAHLAEGVVVMPPAYVNVGAFVDSGTMIDSHALVGSCAQVGQRVHLSAAAQLGGVLEPIHAKPVVIEDDVFVGALAGVFEGVVVRERAVLAAGVVLTAASVLYDLVHGVEHRGEVPAGAVVVPGTRPASGDYASARGLQLAAPMIVKYRDTRTDAATALEGALRS
ncbi:MAG: 2,3,4,5-tetrahydropyridine-2,6-dicarboxylate N-succinyltransferase [Planctomycetota bacterium]